MYISVSSRTTWPVSGCRVWMDSISSPKNSMRTASSSYMGMISTVSPRTRKVPRWKSTSLRTYCICTNRRRSTSRSISAPRRRVTICSMYSSGVPRP